MLFNKKILEKVENIVKDFTTQFSLDLSQQLTLATRLLMLFTVEQNIKKGVGEVKMDIQGIKNLIIAFNPYRNLYWEIRYDLAYQWLKRGLINELQLTGDEAEELTKTMGPLYYNPDKVIPGYSEKTLWQNYNQRQPQKVIKIKELLTRWQRTNQEAMTQTQEETALNPDGFANSILGILIDIKEACGED